MSRSPRPVCIDVPLHIVQRGNNRNPCFFCGNDYRTFLDMLAEATQEFACRVHAYVLMPNHVHLLVSPHTVTAPAGLMKRIGQRYAQFVNRKYKRVGTLWQGRYHSSLVDTELYFLACQRYIELNPVRAGIVRHPVDYDWSSYRVHAHGEQNRILVPHALYDSLDKTANERQAAYRALFSDGMPVSVVDQLRQGINSNGVCGSQEFCDRMGAAAGRDFRKQSPGPRSR